MPPSMVTPASSTQPTAPYPGLQKPPVAIPWPSNAIQWTSWSNKPSNCCHCSLMAYIFINYGHFTSSLLCGSSFIVQFGLSWHGFFTFMKNRDLFTFHVEASRKMLYRDVMTLHCNTARRYTDVMQNTIRARWGQILRQTKPKWSRSARR